MGLQVGAVEAEFVRHCARGCNLGKQALLASALGPAVVTVVDGRSRSVLARAVTPAAADLGHVQDVGDDTPIIDAWLAGKAAR